MSRHSYGRRRCRAAEPPPNFLLYLPKGRAIGVYGSHATGLPALRTRFAAIIALSLPHISGIVSHVPPRRSSITLSPADDFLIYPRAGLMACAHAIYDKAFFHGQSTFDRWLQDIFPVDTDFTGGL